MENSEIIIPWKFTGYEQIQKQQAVTANIKNRKKTDELLPLKNRTVIFAGMGISVLIVFLGVWKFYEIVLALSK